MMYGLLHVLAVLVVLPYVGLAVGFLLIGEMAGARSLPAVLGMLWSHTDRMLRWGLYLLPAAALALVAIGFVPRLRRASLLALAVLSGGSLLTIGVISATPIGIGEFAFLLPCAVVLLASGAMLARCHVR